jgi:copper chaperone CopZ
MKKSYRIEVDCANCAAKMERALGKLPGVQRATVSYLTQKLSVEAEDPEALLPEIVKTCKRVDADFELLG